MGTVPQMQTSIYFSEFEVLIHEVPRESLRVSEVVMQMESEPYYLFITIKIMPFDDKIHLRLLQIVVFIRFPETEQNFAKCCFQSLEKDLCHYEKPKTICGTD